MIYEPLLTRHCEMISCPIPNPEQFKYMEPQERLDVVKVVSLKVARLSGAWGQLMYLCPQDNVSYNSWYI